MWKFVSYDFKGNFISNSGRCTATAAINSRLMGIGRCEDSSDSVFCTSASQDSINVKNLIRKGDGS
jgi:hypothetical protein